VRESPGSDASTDQRAGGRKKTVLYLAWAPFFSGAERALLLTLQAMRDSPYRASVVVGTDGELANQVRALGLRCHVSPLQQLTRRRPVASTWSASHVAIEALRTRPDIVHANDMPSYQAGGFVSKLLGIPAVTHLRFPDSAEAYRWFFRPRFSHALFISESFKSEALAAAPDVFSGRSSVVYDAVRPPHLWSQAERDDARRRLGLEPDSVVVALTGQVSEIKGIWEFVAAADRLRHTRAMFVVLGDDLKTGGALRARMEAEVERLGLADRFRFLGFRPDAPDLVQLFDIVAVPSHVEPFGLAALEAMAAGRPVVATRVGGLPEVVAEGATALLVPPRDPDSLALALRDLLDDPVRRGEFGRLGRQRASNVFSEQAHAGALTRTYDSLLRPK